MAKLPTGFVPAYKPHKQYLCAHYQCLQPREIGRRFCKFHALIYDTEALSEEAKILPFVAE